MSVRNRRTRPLSEAAGRTVLRTVIQATVLVVCTCPDDHDPESNRENAAEADRKDDPEEFDTKR